MTRAESWYEDELSRAAARDARQDHRDGARTDLPPVHVRHRTDAAHPWRVTTRTGRILTRHHTYRRARDHALALWATHDQETA